MGRHFLPRLSLVVGPEIAYLLKGEVWGTYKSRANGRPSEFGTVDYYRFDYTVKANRVELLLKLGLEADLPVGQHALTLHGRYVHGIAEQDRAGTLSEGTSIGWTQAPRRSR